MRAATRLTRPARRPRPCPPGGLAAPPPEGLACPGEPLRGGGRSAQRHVSSWRGAAALEEDRWGESQREVRLPARPQPRRGGSPSSPRVCASCSLAGGNHGVQRGRGRRQRRGGGEGEWQEEEAGRPGHGLAHLLQCRHDRGVSGRGHAVGRQRGAAAGHGAAARSGGSRVQLGPGEAGSGEPAGWRSRGVAGCASRGRRGAAGSGASPCLPGIA